MTALSQFALIRRFGTKMEIKTLPLGMIGANCYMIKTEKSAVVIDIGKYSKAVVDFLKENEDKERLILLTHCHFDHIGGAEAVSLETGVKIAIGENEADFLLDGKVNLSDTFHAKINPFCANIKLKDNEEFSVGDITFKVIETKGHTSGGVCYLAENSLFSGDTLFFESIGRTDFITGNYKEIIDSIKKLTLLPEDTVVYPGHGEPTTIGHEKIFNPYLRG